MPARWPAESAATVLLTDLGGITYAWTSPLILALGVVAVIALIGFLLAEHRAAEPVLPLRLFRERTFLVSSGIGLVVGFALFGSVTYLPLFLQVVNGASPTGSGLQMLPMMGGMLLTSITSGQLISRWGRYKVFPIAGTATMSLGLFLLSRMTAATTVTEASIDMLVLGLGLGMVMQVLVIAVQNAVDYRDLGVATSGATLFRLIGGALGTAAFGAIFADRLAAHLSQTLPAGAPAVQGAGAGLSPQMLAGLSPAMRAIYVNAFTASLSTVFLTAMGIALSGFLLTWLLPERPLRETIAATAGDVGAEAGAVFPMPTTSDSVAKLERALSLLATRDMKRSYIEGVITRAGVDLSPIAAWLLVRIEQNPDLDVVALGQANQVDPERIDTGTEELRRKKLVVDVPPENGGGPRREVRDAGCHVLGRLVDARRARLTEVLAEGAPEQRQELATALGGLPHELVRDAPRRVASG